MTDQTVPEKPCSRCGTVFPATLEFFRKEGTKVAARCKRCCAATNKQWKQNNPEKARKHAGITTGDIQSNAESVWKLGKKEQEKTERHTTETLVGTSGGHAQQATTTTRNRQEEFNRWMKMHPGYFRQWYAAHQEEILVRCKKRYAANPQHFMMLAMVSNARRAARKKDFQTPMPTWIGNMP